MRTKCVFRRARVIGLAAVCLLPACGDDGGGTEIPDAQPVPDAGTDAMPPPAAELMIAPPSQDFGSIAIGSSSTASTFTVTNNGEADSAVLTTTITGDGFAVETDGCDGMTLAPAATCEISVVFTPAAAGDATGTLTVGDGTQDVSASLTGAGLAVGALAISPTPHDYGDVVIGQSARQDFTVTNDGDADSGTISASVGGGDATEFSVITDGCSGQVLAPEASCTITIDFVPASAGDKTTTLTVSDGVGDPVTGTLSGAGIEDATLEVSPSSGDFGTVTVNTESGDTVFTVTNAGDVTSGTITAALGGTDSDAFKITDNGCDAKTLAADASCTITVRFAPSSEGARSATLDISAAPGGTVSATLSGEAVTPGQLSIAPTPHDFGDAEVGTTGSSQTFTVTNDGGSPTGTLSTAVTDSNASSFDVDSDGCDGQTLGAGASCDITVTFAPDTAGDLSASLQVSADPGGNVQAALLGTGLASAQLAIEPIDQDFGSVGLDDPVQANFTVTNVGDLPSGAITVDISGDFNQFTQTNNCTSPLDGGETCTVTVTYDPTLEETNSADLIVSATPGGSATADLTGTGVVSADLVFQGGASLNFGGIVVDYESAVGTLTVINNGDLATGTVDVSITGADAGDFKIISDSCDGSPLASGATCKIDVAFAPGSPGAKSAEVSLTANPGSDIAAALSGNAIAKLVIAGNTANDDGSFDTPIKVGNDATHTFILTNNGEERDLSIAIEPPDAGFTVDPIECLDLADGGQCTINVTFEADENLDLHEATLTVNADGAEIDAEAQLALSATVEGALVIDATAHDYGEVIIGTTPGTHIFTITNEGGVSSGPITATLTSSTDFAITDDQCAGGVDAGLTCTITVEFDPQVAGPLADTLTVSSAIGGVTAAVSGVGLDPADLVISGEPFGDVVVTTSTTRTFTVSNPGDVDATNLATSIGGDAEFSIVTNGCDALTSLGPDGQCDIVVEFAPDTTSSLGPHAGTLDATADGGLSASADLDGNALSQLTISPASHVFPDTVEGETSAQAIFQVTNVGSQLVTGISAFASSGAASAFSVTSDCGSLNAGLSCLVTVTFTPPSSGDFAAVLTAEANATATASADISGKGLQAATLVADPELLGFGGVVAGSQGGNQAVTFTNTGDVPTGTLTATEGSTEFPILVDNCSATALAPGATCQVIVEFSPDEASRGDLASFVEVGDGVTADSATLTGVALTPSANLTFFRESADFGTVTEGAVSTPLDFTLTNNSESEVTPTITTPEGFAASDDCDTLAPGTSCTVTVTFEPAVGAGNRDFSGRVIADSNDPSVDSGVLFVKGQSTVPAGP